MINCQNNKITLNNIYRGDTWNGFSFQLLDDDHLPIDILDIEDVFIQFKRSPLNSVADFEYKLSENTIIKDMNDIFNLTPLLMDFEVGLYVFDVQITYVGGAINTLFSGNLSIIQDVTR